MGEGLEMGVKLCKYVARHVRAASKICGKCAEPLCKWCGKERNGVTYCDECIDDLPPVKNYRFK